MSSVGFESIPKEEYLKLSAAMLTISEIATKYFDCADKGVVGDDLAEIAEITQSYKII